jgi:hypothetical protein
VADKHDGRWTDRRPEPERCRRIAGFLWTARSLVSEYLTIDPDWAGRPGSHLGKELSHVERTDGKEFRDEVQAAVNNAGILLFATVQHLESIAVLLGADVPPIYSLTALARVAMELGAGAWRLTDPTIDARTRVARLSLDRLNSARELDKLLTETGMTRAELGNHASLEETAKKIEALGLAVKVGERSSAGDRVDGHERPAISTTMETFAGRHIETDSKRIYRLFSAVTHGTQWGVTVFFSTKDTADGRLSSEFAVEQGWVDGASLVGAESYAWAVENFVALLGWDEQPLNRWMTKIDAIFGDLLGA